MGLRADIPELCNLLTQRDLARRWRVSPRTIERWRVLGRGPRFCRIGRQIRYRLCDVCAYETERLDLAVTHTEEGKPD